MALVPANYRPGEESILPHIGRMAVYGLIFKLEIVVSVVAAVVCKFMPDRHPGRDLNQAAPQGT